MLLSLSAAAVRHHALCATMQMHISIRSVSERCRLRHTRKFHYHYCYIQAAMAACCVQPLLTHSAWCCNLELMQFCAQCMHKLLHIQFHFGCRVVVCVLFLGRIENCAISKRIRRERPRERDDGHRIILVLHTNCQHLSMRLTKTEHGNRASATPTIYDFIGMHARRLQTFEK